MTVLTYLDKAEKDLWLPRMFDLLCDNMRCIAPSGLGYEAERVQFLAEVSPALDKAPRQVILCLDGDELVGFLQFYTRDTLLMVEEVQLRKDHQRTLLFFRLCRFLTEALPDGITAVEAFADKRNLNSQRIMYKLGMQVLTDGIPYPNLLHLRGEAASVKKHFSSKRKQGA